MTQNSHVNFELIHFLLLIKGRIKVPIFSLPNMLWWKCAKFLMSFLKAHVIFPSNFASVFSSIKNNFSILFLAQTLSDLSTWENCLPRDFDYNSIQNTNILGGAFGNFLTSKLLLFTKIWPNNSLWLRCHHNIKTHSELCETRMIELFCENNEQLKGVI